MILLDAFGWLQISDLEECFQSVRGIFLDNEWCLDVAHEFALKSNLGFMIEHISRIFPTTWSLPSMNTSLPKTWSSDHRSYVRCHQPNFDFNVLFHILVSPLNMNCVGMMILLNGWTPRACRSWDPAWHPNPGYGLCPFSCFFFWLDFLEMLVTDPYRLKIFCLQQTGDLRNPSGVDYF